MHIRHVHKDGDPDSTALQGYGTLDDRDHGRGIAQQDAISTLSVRTAPMPLGSRFSTAYHVPGNQ